MDLFSFLDDSPQENAPQESENDMVIDVPKPGANGSRKRKAESSVTSPGPSKSPAILEDGAANSLSKKARVQAVSAPQPLVVDQFETEAKREVAASAGLMGAVEIAGSRLELKHQVCPRQ